MSVRTREFPAGLILVLAAGCGSAATKPSGNQPVDVGSPERSGTSAAALGDAAGSTFALEPAPVRRAQVSTASDGPPPSGSWLEAKARYDAGEFSDAADDFEKFYTVTPRSKQAEDALFFAAEASFQAGKHYHALELYERLLAQYPQTTHYPEALERTFQIGKLFVEESAKKPSWFLGLKFASRDYGIEILERFVKTRERHPLSPEALFLVGVAHMHADEPELAIESWQRLVKDYPQSNWARIAEYRIALAFVSLSYGVEYDKRPRLTALRRLRAYIRKYPSGDNVQEAEQKLAQLEEELAQHDLRTAKEYARAAHEPGHGLQALIGFFTGAPSESRYVSAQIYLNAIRREYPKTNAAKEAAQLAGEWPNPPLPPAPPDIADTDRQESQDKERAKK